LKLGLAIEDTAEAERELAGALLDVGERHRTDHDVFHVTRTLADLALGHVERLASHAARYEASVEDELDGDPGPAKPVRAAVEKGAELIGRRPEPGIMLLRDLRRLHLLAAEASIDWVALAQGAQAAKDPSLLETVGGGHDETLRTLKWTTYRLKAAAPQVLTSA
jgi:hypothetical protein